MDRLAFACRDEADCSTMARKGIRHGPLTLAIAALARLACLTPADPVMRDVQSVIDRTVPRHGRMIPGDASRRVGQTLRASWKVEVDMQWDAYGCVDPKSK